MAAFKQELESTVKYKIYPGQRHGRDINYLEQENLETSAENCIHKIGHFIHSYIWHNESFNLRVVNGSSTSRPHLEGSTYFGENIEDEWFIVFLLFYLSKEITDLIIQVQDEDGEFLLIEAADHLPKWLNNDTSVNRVFIYKGQLHIIPVAQSPAEITPIPSGTPSLVDALDAVHDYATITQASKPIQDAINRRIKDYPQKIDVNKHRAHCYLPYAVAAILREDPKLLPHAVKAFYTRDPLDMKACRAMRFFAPETRVMTNVTFTRCLYAQLTCQKYEPDKRTGWNLPCINSPERKAHELGMKLACGFEILASNANMNDDEESIGHDFHSDVRWKRFAASLKDKGYFRAERDEYTNDQLMMQAKDFYLSTLKKDRNANFNPGMRIRVLLLKLSVDYDILKREERYIGPEDDDSWMDLTPEKLDEMLSEMSQKPKESFYEKITRELDCFLSHKSDVEGVEIPDSTQNESSCNKSKKQKINFDPDAFADAVNHILDFRIPGSDDEGSSSSMGGYSDDEDEDVALSEEHCDENRKDRGKNISDMKFYMDQMDRELAETDVGLSFERLPPKAPTASKDEDDLDINEEEDHFQPVNVDLTALKNILESYSSQQGLPGPASNLFTSLGIKLPDNSDS